VADDKTPVEAPKSPSLVQSLLALPSRNLENPPAFSGQADAMVREALKDVNSTIHQVFFGAPAGPGEPGTPLVPTQAMVTQDLGTMMGYQELMDGYSNKGPTIQTQEKGMER